MSGTEHTNVARFGAQGLILIGFSAGGLAPLRMLLSGLCESTDASIVIAHHVGDSILPQLIASWTRRKAAFARDGERVMPGRIFVCPPRQHLIINPDATFSVSGRERVRFVIPSIDWLFESGSISFRDRTIAVILSGGRYDGSRGARHVRVNGGRIVVQDPETAAQPSMPAAALHAADAVASPPQLAAAIVAQLERLPLATAIEEWEHPFGAFVA